MIKLIMEVRRKPGLTATEFRDYYESRHAPLAASLMPKCVRYVRNFIVGHVAGEVAYDVIVEMWFDLHGPWQEALQALGDPKMTETLGEDEEKFMDRVTIRVSVVEEVETPPGNLSGTANGVIEKADL